MMNMKDKYKLTLEIEIFPIPFHNVSSCIKQTFCADSIDNLKAININQEVKNILIKNEIDDANLTVVLTYEKNGKWIDGDYQHKSWNTSYINLEDMELDLEND